MMVHRLIAPALALPLAACVGLLGERQRTYVQPRVEVLSAVSRLVSKPARQVRQDFMLALRDSDFYLDRIEDDGLLTLRYSGDPLGYVDCGQISTKVKTAQGERSYIFPAAVGYKRYQILTSGKIYQIERRMSLSARVTLAFSAPAPNKTRVDARTLYSLRRDQAAVAAREKPLLLNDVATFHTGQTGVFPNAETRCQPTGKLEAEVLALLK